MEKHQKRIFFDNIGGSFQFRIRCAGDLVRVLELDATAWAALCVPVASLNGETDFFQALDSDKNGLIGANEVKSAIKFLLEMLDDIKILDDYKNILPLKALNKHNAQAILLYNFARTLPDIKNTLTLQKIRAQLAAVKSGPLSGNGILTARAVNSQEALELFTEITTLQSTPDALNSVQLEKFYNDAENFVRWSQSTMRPLFRNDDPTEYFALFKALEKKIDEYFQYCELIIIDQAHEKRFKLDQATLPELDLQDSTALAETIQNAPLAQPSDLAVLEFKKVTNSQFRELAARFAEKFQITTLDRQHWQQLKEEFAEYNDYSACAQSNAAGCLGAGKLEKLLSGSGFDDLRKLFDQDKTIGSIVENLHQIERLLLYCSYLMEFVNNFVSFEDFFNADRISMLQAGRLVMDGKSYTLAVWIDNIAEHKKIAVRSGMCLLYLEVISSGKDPVKRQVAVAATAGSIDRIYINKPAFFIDNAQRVYHGRVVDMVAGPISFFQTVFSPLNRLSDAIGRKLQDLTDFSAKEKKLEQALDKAKLPPPTPVKPAAPGHMLNNNSMMLLAGGLSLAAIGASLSFILKALTGAVTAISALKWYVILIWLAILPGIYFIPMSIFAFLLLRKRNLTMFLEAGGWAVNLPMKLNMNIAGIFTRSTEYPPGSVFKIIKPCKKPQKTLFIVLVIAILITAAAAFWYLHRIRLR